MQLSHGSVVNFTPDPDRYILRASDPKVGDGVQWPIIGWAIEVTWSSADAGRQSEGSDTRLKPVVIANGEVMSLSDMCVDFEWPKWEVLPA